MSVIKETSTNAAVRDAATDQIKVIEEWAVGLDYREDVYRSSRPTPTRIPILKAKTPSCSPIPCAITAGPAWICQRTSATKWRPAQKALRLDAPISRAT